VTFAGDVASADGVVRGGGEAQGGGSIARVNGVRELDEERSKATAEATRLESAHAVAEKALVADLVGPESRATAFGIYSATLGVGGLAASVLFGVVADTVSMPAAFAIGAVLALAATAALTVIGQPARYR